MIPHGGTIAVKTKGHPYKWSSRRYWWWDWGRQSPGYVIELYPYGFAAYLCLQVDNELRSRHWIRSERIIMSRQQIITDQAPVPFGPYSQAIVANGFLFTSGQTPHDSETRAAVGVSIEEQTVQTLKNLEAILDAHSLNFSHLVKVTVHLQEPERDRAGFNATYEKLVPTPHPTRTTVGSFLGNFLVEIDAVAVIPSSQKR
jgi:2-iminobutanoate/2-iminopropanoate deaminase